MYPVFLLPNHLQITVLLSCRNSFGFRGYPEVSVLLVVKPLAKSQGILALGFQCPYVIVGIWGYPFLLVPQGCKSYFRKAAGCVGFSWVSGHIRFLMFFCSQITCKSQCHQSYFRVSIPMVFVGIRGYPFRLWSNSLQITGCPCFRVSMSEKLLPKSGGCFLGFRGYPGISVF